MNAYFLTRPRLPKLKYPDLDIQPNTRPDMSRSQEFPSWITRCKRDTLSVAQKMRSNGGFTWCVINTDLTHSVDIGANTFDEAKRILDIAKPMLDLLHQNIIGCCASPEEKLAYATPCAKETISVVRKPTMTGRDVWDVTDGRTDQPVTMMFESFEAAKSTYEIHVNLLKARHGGCCIISD